MVVSAVTGSLPTSVGYLTNLAVLQASGCSLRGSIPSTVGYLTRLMRWVVIGEQQADRRILEGVCVSLSLSTSVQYVDLGGTSLSSSMSAAIGSLTSLKYVDLHGNRMKGAIPTTLARLTALYVVPRHGRRHVERTSVSRRG